MYCYYCCVLCIFLLLSYRGGNKYILLLCIIILNHINRVFRSFITRVMSTQKLKSTGEQLPPHRKNFYKFVQNLRRSKTFRSKILANSTQNFALSKLIAVISIFLKININCLHVLVSNKIDNNVANKNSIWSVCYTSIITNKSC